MDGVVLPLNIIINISDGYLIEPPIRSLSRQIAQNCALFLTSTKWVIKKTNEEWLVELELHCVYLFQTFWTHNFLRRPLSECQ